jgi:hypothetical protein
LTYYALRNTVQASFNRLPAEIPKGYPVIAGFTVFNPLNGKPEKANGASCRAKPGSGDS